MMKEKPIIFFFLFLFLTSVPSHAILIWLENGDLLHGEIVEHDEKTILFKRFDNEGILQVPWEKIHPRCVKEIKTRLGLIEKAPPVYKTSGIEVYLKTGGVAAGKLVKQTSEYLYLKTKNGEIPIPVSNILTTDPVSLPLTQIYKPEEIYKVFSSEYDLQSAAGNYGFGEFLARAGHYSKAKMHLLKAKQLDEKWSLNVDSLLNEILKTTDNLQLKRNIELYHVYKNSNRYDKATHMLKQLQPHLEASDFQRYEREIREEKVSYLRSQIPDKWVQSVRKKIAKFVFNRKFTLAQAREYLSEKIEKETLEELAQETGIPEEEVLDYLEKREGNRHYRYGYRDGTFIVGTTGRLPNERKLSSEAWRPVKGVSDSLFSPEQWWQTATTGTRQEWLSALYFENRFKVVDQELRPCSQCSGRGYEVRSARETICPVCHGVKYERTIVVK